jgi:tetratricopeptide (TPR) repeat protein
MNGYSIELTNPSNRFGDYRAVVGSTGIFEVQGVPPGTYQLRIFKDNQMIQQEWVTATTSASLIQLRLPESSNSARPASGTISVKRLSHKPPKQAIKHMNRAAAAREKGDLHKSLEHLQSAVEIDPEYVEAFVNLGARYVELQRVDEAADAFERAIQIDPHCAQAHSNYALVMIQKGKPREAAASARRAVDIDGGNMRAHYVLGYSLALQDPSSEEALQHFVRASEAYPLARLGAAQILLQRGDQQRAETELKAYLRTGDQHKREAVRSFLAKLKQ